MLTVTRLSHAKGNDVNGNPRRLYVIQKLDGKHAERIAVRVESHDGNGAWQREFPDAIFIADYEVPASLWNIYKRMENEN
jgi:hypothetical protein